MNAPPACKTRGLQHRPAADRFPQIARFLLFPSPLRSPCDQPFIFFLPENFAGAIRTAAKSKGCKGVAGQLSDSTILDVSHGGASLATAGCRRRRSCRKGAVFYGSITPRFLPGRFPSRHFQCPCAGSGRCRSCSLHPSHRATALRRIGPTAARARRRLPRV